MSSLKISLKIPKPSTEQHTKATSYKATKRRITSDDESDNTVSPRRDTSPQKPSKKPRISRVDDVDPQQATRPGYQSSHPTAAKPRALSGLTKKPTKKKKRIVSDEEEDEEELVPESVEKSTGVGMKPKNKDLKSKIKPIPSGAAKITAKNGSTSADAPTISALIGKKRARTEEDDLKGKDMDVDVTSVSAAPTASVLAPTANAEPPKKKLPTIKKKPKIDSASGSTFVSPAPVPPPKPTINPGKADTSSAAKSQPSTAAVFPKKPAAPLQATTVNPSGTGDFDLRDMNTWASLIGEGTSSSGPRIGIEKRVSTEERRKQLDKMRNEARVRREEQFQHTFDLQAQSQKIALFEKKFASHKVRMPGPNILGAAFKVRPIPRS